MPKITAQGGASNARADDAAKAAAAAPVPVVVPDPEPEPTAVVVADVSDQVDGADVVTFTVGPPDPVPDSEPEGDPGPEPEAKLAVPARTRRRSTTPRKP